MLKSHKNKSLPIRIGILSFVLGVVITLGLLTYLPRDSFSNYAVMGVSLPSPLVTDDPYPIRTVWRSVNDTSPNVSHFIYRDLNRNGVYDVGDRPMVGIAVRLTRPDGSQVIRRSNIRGFVNFTNSLTATPVDVSQPGEYQFKILIPDGWIITSDNAIQTADYRKKPGSRPGIIADHVPVPAGLAQVLTLSGQVVNSEGQAAGSQTQVTVRSENGQHYQQTVDRQGRFAFEMESGHWRIEAVDPASGQRTEREVDIQQAPVRLSRLILDEKSPVRDDESMIIVDFEDITLSLLTKIPNGPAGLAWYNLNSIENEYARGEGYINNTQSGRYAGYNTSGYPVTISHPQGFNFHGGYFGVAWMQSAEGETLHIRAWRDDQLVGAESYTLSALGPFWFDAEYYNITRLELETEHYWQFVTDDLVFSMPTAQ